MSVLVLVLAGALPWLTVLPLGGATAVLAHTLTLIAAFHGAGQTLAWASRRQVSSTLAIQWGIAALVAISGLLIALRLDRYAAQVVLVLGFAAAHTIYVVRRAPFLRATLHDVFTRDRLWLVPALLLVALGTLHVLAAAGDLGAGPFDDDGHVLAQLQRLCDTGALDDGIGYARRFQLGGQLALTALATVPGDVHLARSFEAVAFVLAIAFALARLRIHESLGALWALLLIIAAVALPFVPADPVPCWSAVGLVLALHVMLTGEQRPPAVFIGLVAGALIALRLELAPIGVVAIVTAWRPSEGRRHVLGLALGAFAAVVPLLVTRSLAVRGLDVSLLADKRLPLALGLALGTAAAVACLPLAIWTWRSPLRWYAIATALTIGGIVGELTGDRPYALRFLWPVVLAFALMLTIELVRARTVSTVMMIAALLVGAVIYQGRNATGRVRWTRRYLDYVTHVEYLRHAGDHAPTAGGYDELVRRVPAGQTVAVWVTRPERLPYAAGVRIVDLRTPRSQHLRRHRWDVHSSQIEDLARRAGAAYLLVEADHRRVERGLRSPLYRVLCSEPNRGCADDLELVALDHRVIASTDGIQLVKLR